MVQAEAIIDTRVQGFMRWLESRETVPVIHDLQQAAADVQAAELERARRLLARGESPEAVLEQLAHGLTQKYLHGPMAALNRSDGDERRQLLAMVPRLAPLAPTLYATLPISIGIFAWRFDWTGAAGKAEPLLAPGDVQAAGDDDRRAEPGPRAG